MKQLMWGVAALLLALTFALPAKAGWVLTFADEFSQAGINYLKWSTDPINGPQPINGQLHYDAPDAFAHLTGAIRLKAERRQIGVQSYTSGFLATLNHFHQQYGWFEMRARFPRGRGFWPAFWLIPADQSWPPEIDIVENLGHDTTRSYLTFHWTPDDSTGATVAGLDFTSYHTFAVNWQPGLIVWYIDGVERYRVTGANVPSKPMYIIVNLAVGGSWAGPPDSSTPFPGYMDVDYVRVYKQVQGQGYATIPRWDARIQSTPSPVNTVPSFIVSPTVPNVTQIPRGKTIRLTTNLTSNIAYAQSRVVFYVRDSAGNQVGDRMLSPYNFTALQKQTAAFDFVVPAGGRTGTYTVDVGIFASDWKLLRWAGGTGRFQVN